MNGSTNYFSIQAQGNKPTLYTSIDVYDSTRQMNSRRVYKYNSISTINVFSATYKPKNFTMPFIGSRQYCDIVLTPPSTDIGSYTNTSTTNSYILPYSSRVADTSTTYNWINDTAYGVTNKYIGWSFGNINTSANFMTTLFNPTLTNNQGTWFSIELKPFYTFQNQFGDIVSQISWDGTVTAPLVTSRNFNLTQQLSIPILTPDTTLNTNLSVDKYSVSTLQ
jgi:hypothetical protein